MKKTLLIMLMSVFLGTLNAQKYDNLQNGGMETWEDIDLYDYPDGTFSSLQEDTSTLHQITVSGDMGVRIETKIIDGDTIGGYIVWGTPSDGMPVGLPFTADVDTIEIELRYSIAAGDTGFILGALSATGGNEDFMEELYGTNATFHTVKIPLSYTGTVDSLWIGLVSANVMKDNNTGATDGNYVEFKSIVLKHNGAEATAQLENNELELWSTLTYSEPAYWNSMDGHIAGYGLNTLSKVSSTVEGSYAVQVSTIEIYDDTLPGVITTGYFNEDNDQFEGGLPWMWTKPASLTGSYKYSGQNGDSANIKIYFRQDGIPIAYAQKSLGDAASFTTFSIDVTVPLVADTVFVYFESGDQPGSVLTVDNLTFTGGTVTINELETITALGVYPNPAKEILNVEYTLMKDEDVNITISDSQGRMIVAQQFANGAGRNLNTINISGLANGIYIYRMNIGDGVLVRTFSKE